MKGEELRERENVSAVLYLTDLRIEVFVDVYRRIEVFHCIKESGVLTVITSMALLIFKVANSQQMF